MPGLHVCQVALQGADRRGEWVEVANDGPRPIRLTGLKLPDYTGRSSTSTSTRIAPGSTLTKWSTNVPSGLRRYATPPSSFQDLGPAAGEQQKVTVGERSLSPGPVKTNAERPGMSLRFAPPWVVG
jgi:hypothetical protein